ncbi:MAG: hypothetical protein QNJ09_14545 [Paracoccaceae bacterium]|nr:hypothetical protein [Paracoccaceae bacterium]
MELVIGLLSGAVGGNVVGAALKNLNQGPLLNSLAGIVGGGLGGQILSMLGAGGMADAATGGGMDLTAILGQVASGGVGGGALLAIVGMLRNAMGK